MVVHGCGALWEDFARGPGTSGQMMRIAGVWAGSDRRGPRTAAPKTAKFGGSHELEEITRQLTYQSVHVVMHIIKRVS